MADSASVNGFKILADFVAALLWPGVVFFFLLYFRHELRAFLARLTELSVKAGSFEAVAKRQAEAAVLLGQAEAAKTPAAEEGGAPALPAEARARSIATAVSAATPPRMAERLANATVLWVDDHPENNELERRALEAMGIRFVLATSTDEATRQLRFGRFDAVISDLGRRGDDEAGLTLLDQVRPLGIPVIIYAGTGAVRRRDEIVRRGAFGVTASPQELFRLVTDAIRAHAGTAAGGR